jgi:hypothetical protein
MALLVLGLSTVALLTILIATEKDVLQTAEQQQETQEVG